jgi:hypothetical protein
MSMPCHIHESRKDEAMSFAMSGNQVNTSHNISVLECETSKCLSARLHRNSESIGIIDLLEL